MPAYLSLQQVPDVVAIVDVDGKEQFFDPGERFCSYGHLAWQHAAARGIRQLDGGIVSITATTPAEPYIASITQRVADLTLAPDGTLSGPVTLFFTGSPALEWRHRALVQGDAATRSAFKDLLTKMLPAGTEVQLTAIDNLTDGEQKLTVRYLVHGNLGSSAGGKVTLPADLFAASAPPAFSSEKRDLPVDFHFPYQIQDVMRVRFPAGYSVESAPASEKYEYARSAAYTFLTESTPTSVTVRRIATMADTIVPVAEYPHLRAYTMKLEQKSQQRLVLKGNGTGGS